MRAVFADAGYWIAFLHSEDPLHGKAIQLSEAVQSTATTVVTSQMVLAEVLNFFARYGSVFRHRSVAFVQDLDQSGIAVIPQTSDQFSAALSLYKRRPDKGWGLTDCASILIMQDLGITEALAHDSHFEQAGFRALLK